MLDYDCLDSFGMREVKFLPPHFFTLTLPVNDLHSYDTGTPVTNFSTFFKDETIRFRNFLEEKMTGRYHVTVASDASDENRSFLTWNSPSSKLLIGFEKESDMTLFNLLIVYKHRT